MTRTFAAEPGVRHAIPLFIGIVGPSSSGKTRSAFRLAAGIAQVDPGEIAFINTEGARGLADIDLFRKPDGSPLIQHVPFSAPYRSSDYLDAILYARNELKAKTIIIDSMSHEHEAEGGMLDYQDQELRRLAGEDYGTWKADKYNMLAWQKPKAERRRLLTRGIMQTDANIIACFRAKDTAKPVKESYDSGGQTKSKTVVKAMGFTPVAGDEFVFEMALSCLLLPGSRGVPSWESEYIGERLAMKRNDQLQNIVPDGEQLSEEIGKNLALWAKGPGGKREQTPIDKYALEFSEQLKSEKIVAWWKSTAKRRESLEIPPERLARMQAAVDAKTKPKTENDE